jgi:hypothetical protein
VSSLLELAITNMSTGLDTKLAARFSFGSGIGAEEDCYPTWYDGQKKSEEITWQEGAS